MALPPEPIEEVLPQATWVVDAVVAEVLSTGPAVAKVNAPERATSTGQKSSSQQVKLTVKRTLHGTPLTEITVEKPVAQYMLAEGNKGPFLIDASKKILGRYGPDSYSWDRIEKALKKN